MPVRWQIGSQSLSCAASLRAPDLGLDYMSLEPGVTTLSFTRDEPGVYVSTYATRCSRGRSRPRPNRRTAQASANLHRRYGDPQGTWPTLGSPGAGDHRARTEIQESFVTDCCKSDTTEAAGCCGGESATVAVDEGCCATQHA
ncbi:hypothetical protein N868_13055 [Cellulomonas carbonis T26]|uniref:Uncharacterized protein n=1 Tax=Cellulomonas carbonis T26 TaxID=947969 RepID=A0A0A0BTB6_9CELL|nr:hypothetical protein N868_13055 [Cellulomonas carbonis T26]